MNELAEASVAQSSRFVYNQTLKRYEETFGDWRDKDDIKIADNLVEMHKKGYSPSTINLVISAIRYAAKKEGVKTPIGEVCHDTVSGIARSKIFKNPTGQAKPIKWDECLMIAQACATDGHRGLRDASIFMVGSDALLRRSEIIAINIEDITFEDDIALLNIRRSKSDQKAEGTTMFLGEDTVKYLMEWIYHAGIDHGPLFRPVYGKTVIHRALSPRQINRIIAKRCAENGIYGARGHSLRVGGAVSLAAKGASLVEMQQAGRWKSPIMPGKYAAGEIAKRGPVARYRYKKVK